MALINSIRRHSGLTAGVIAGGLIFFLIGGDIFRLGSVFSGRRKTDVGEVAGQSVSLQRFQAQLAQLRQQLPAGTQETLLTEQAWRQIIVPIIYNKECDALGLMVGEDELVDMVQGNHIHPELETAFRNPTTNQFEKKALVSYLQNLAKMAAAHQRQWQQFEQGLASLRRREKLMKLVEQSAFVTSLEAETQYGLLSTLLSLRCLYIPYHTYPAPNDGAEISDAAMLHYLKAHASAYQVEESNHLQYIVFPVTPTEEEEHAFRETLQALKRAFGQAQDNVAFAKANTDGSHAHTSLRFTHQALPDALSAKKLQPGLVIGPVQESGLYKLYKIVAITLNEAQPYEVAVIEKQLLPGEQARDRAFRKADYCASTVKGKTQLEEYATHETLQLQSAQVGKNDVQIGLLPKARELARWLYNDAKVGKVSPVFDLSDAYVVAVMTGHVDEGIAPLEQVRDELALKVQNEQKAAAIMAKLRETTATTLDEKATQYGEQARCFVVNDLHFVEDTLRGVGLARKAVGASFALQLGECATVEDENGVLVVEVVDRSNAEDLESVETYQQRLAQLARKNQYYDAYLGLEELAKVKDKRYLFY